MSGRLGTGRLRGTPPVEGTVEEPSPARLAMWRAMTEADLLRAVTKAARLYGWMLHHDLPVRDMRGRTRTAVAGDTGFPDLVLARAGEVIIVELKSESGRFEPGQKEWLRALGTAYVVKPRHMDTLLGRIRTPPPVAEGTPRR